MITAIMDVVLSDIWLTLFTLTFLEILLGVDNLMLIAVMADRLPKKRQEAARKIGLSLALVTRLLFLASVVWLTHLETVFFYILSHGYNFRDVLLFGGGIFLLYKGVTETIAMKEAQQVKVRGLKQKSTFWAVIIQIILLDIVFSVDTVLTAVALTDILWVMMLAVVIAIGIMLFGIEYVAALLKKNKRLKVLALAFLFILGLMLMVEGLHLEYFAKGISSMAKSYLYTAMFFSLFVELLNMWVFHKTKTPADNGRE